MRKDKCAAAFSLIEVLVVMVVIGVIFAAGFGTVTWRPTARRESEMAMRWLYAVLARSYNSGASFDLSVDSNAAAPGLMVVWTSGNMENERWSAGEGCKLKRVSSSGGPNIHYSPQWGTFTPALTVKVTGSAGDICYLIISGQGRLRVSDSPPVD